MKVVMVMYVRDEEDVLEENLRAHLALGVDHFLIVDHKSEDATPEILRRYSDAGFVDATRNDSDRFQHMESEWGTELARRAASEHGADWVLHADADEFWWPLAGDLKQALGQIPEAYGAALAPRVEYVPRPDRPGSFAERMTVRERFSRVHPKIAHRGHPEVVVPSGAHSVTVPGWQGPPHVGRASLRAGGNRFEGSDRWTPTAPVWTTRLLHFPVRGSEHFARRVELALFATGRNAERRRTEEMLEAHAQGRLGELYEELAFDDEAIAKGVASGELVEDPRLRELLARCPDPLSDPGALASFEATPSQNSYEADLAELAQDAMQAGARAQAMAELRAERERERAERLRARGERKAERLQRKRQRLERKLAATRETGWWRLGRALGRVPGLRRLMPPR
jgi:hypothetical protein